MAALASMAPSEACAQETSGASREPAAAMVLQPTPATFLPRPSAGPAPSARRISWEVAWPPERAFEADRTRQAASAPAGRRRPVWRTVVGAAIGGVGGFFGGAYLGAAIEGDCNCDDPGLRGVLIGAPIGAVAGAIVGGLYL
jgi:hypothetical protein